MNSEAHFRLSFVENMPNLFCFILLRENEKK